MIGGETLSLVTGCMNRTDYLLKVLPTWIALRELDEIVIVDWNSAGSVRNAILAAGLADPRIRLYWVSEADCWDFSPCANLGLGMAQGTRILRTDVDIQISSDFFEDPELVALAKDEFWTGNWVQARDDNEKHLNGTIYAYREGFWKVNGYNERLVGYGYDDEDMYSRLFQAGLGRRILDHDKLAHLPHGDSLRVACAPEIPVRDDDVRLLVPPIASATSSQILARSNSYNRKLAARVPWTATDRRVAWAATFLNKNHWWCRRRQR